MTGTGYGKGSKEVKNERRVGTVSRGIRLPIMRDIANRISKSNIEEFLKYAQDKYYEEVMIQGLVISHIKDEKIFGMQ